MSAIEKDSRRIDRLRYRHRDDDKLRLELEKIAHDECETVVRAFVECAKSQGMMVVFKCRGQNKEMRRCLDEHNSEERFQQLRAERLSSSSAADREST